jgi:murein DD-endopeptidase MepM/ murein hydrolase activator NlpD
MPPIPAPPPNARPFLHLTAVAGVLLALLAALPADAAPPEGAPTFELPLACKINVDCAVQKYFDHDPGPGAKDYMCGDLVNDKHAGIDIRVPSYVDMRRGVAVLAAAPGVVWRIRDGVEDINVREVGKEVVDEYGLGNVVVIDHGNGWRSFYGHMRKGSVAVKEGDRVEAGQQVGLVGLSGLTEFPHVHFMVMRGKTPIDPFTGTAAADPTACGDTSHALWSPKALAELVYTPTGPLIAGFSTDKPEAETARNGGYSANPLPASAATLFFWAEYFGLQQGDRQIFRILGPDGAVLVDYDRPAERRKILMFRYVGTRAPAGGFKPGLYRAEFKLIRGSGGDAQTVIDLSRQVELR